MEEINVIQLIEKNSITRLSRDYENKLVNKIKETFTDIEQQIFLTSFYCFLNYDSKKDFIVDFDNIWKWLGFSRKDPAKRLLEKNFIINIDYNIKKAAPPIGGAAFKDTKSPSKKLGGAGQNKEIILLSVNTFKKFCIKAGTKKADEIHDYYIKLEELLQQTINEETNELRLQLQNKENELISNNEKLIEEKFIRKQLKAKYECFLSRRIDIDNKYEKGECVYLIGFDEMPNKFKIGFTSDLKKRVADFHTEMPCEPIIFYQQYVFNAKLIEQTIHHILRKFRIHNSKEWFQTDDKEIFINEIKDVISFFENKDKHYENKIDIKGNITNILSSEENNSDNSDNEDNESEDVEEKEDEINEESIKIETKKCSQCKLNKIKDEFAKNPTRSDGLNNICKDCKKDNYENTKEKKKITLEEKKCTKCDIVKNISEFYSRVGSPDGKTSECADCTKLMYKNRFEIRKQLSDTTQISEKNCKKCNQILVINAFSKKTDSIDGYNCICKSCVSIKIKEKRQVIKEIPESKCCNTCNKDLPIEKFWNCKSNNDGKNNRCSDCCKEKRKTK